jgi:ubiquinone/menaquinone biosynthesis C-methylase UbiE
VNPHMTTVSDSQRPFVPGMGLDWLLPLYDPLTRLLGLNRTRRDLLLRADLQPGHRVLDIGCGTGSLVVLAKQLFPDVDVVGIDPDDKALSRAVRKARRAGAHIELHRGFADALNYPDASFDRVLSSFMFHHLNRREKERTAREIRRVLKADGALHLLDFGPHAHHRLADNDEGTILSLLRDAGFDTVTKTSERVLLGFVQVIYYRARRSRA